VGPFFRSVEQIIAGIARRQHGIVTWAEMLKAEISKKQIRHRVKIGMLVRVYSGVYSVGHEPLTTEARYMAAVKACGDGAVLCGLAAAYLLGILKVAVPPPPDVLCPTERRIRGLKPRQGQAYRGEVTRVKGIPCMTPARVLVDLAAQLEDDPFARLCHEAGVKYKTTPRQVKTVMARRHRVPGAARIRRVRVGARSRPRARGAHAR
jgi:hypothetical protein